MEHIGFQKPACENSRCDPEEPDRLKVEKNMPEAFQPFLRSQEVNKDPCAECKGDDGKQIS